MHVRRLHRRLIEAGIESRVYCDPRWRGEKELGVIPLRKVTARPLRYFGWTSEPALHIQADIFHMHDDWHRFALTVLMILRRGKKVVITVHNQKEEELWETIRIPMRLASKVLVRDQRIAWIAVSDTIRMQLLAHGIDEKRISVIPAFIPPHESTSSRADLPVTVRNFISSHSPILSVYGSRFALDRNGTDVYGFDLCLDAVRRLRNEFDALGLVLGVTQMDNESYFRQLKDRAIQYGIGNNTLFVTEPLDDAYPVWQASDIYLRPTTTDGDAIAVREALSLKVPVVASDVCPRPTGVVLFKNRDIKEFVHRVWHILTHKEEYVNALKGIEIPDNFRQIVNVYQG